MAYSTARKVIVVTGPSGVGKTHLAKQLLQTYPNEFTEGKVFTTRKPRKQENDPDRIFISEVEFAKKHRNKEFVLAGEFHGNRYGYTLENLQPRRKHILVNTWPAQIPNFLKLKNTIVIGMGSSDTSLLQQRMTNRGDSPQKVIERTQLVKKDTLDLSRQSEKFRPQDKLFVIKSDETLYQEVIPWVIRVLGIRVV